MKRLAIVLLSLLLALGAECKKVTLSEAYSKAQRFMQGKLLPGRRLVKGMTQEKASCPYYIFNAERNGGFVIVAGDDRVPEILGYATTGNCDEAKAPANFKAYLQAYAKAIASLTENYQPSESARAIANLPAIAPMIETKWGQEKGFFEECPIVSGQYTLAGCVATAMAQIINFHKWPKEATADVPGYRTMTYNLTLDELPGYRFDWENMNQRQIPVLMRYCGQAVQMDYGVEGSGAFANLAANAMKRIFGYSEATRYIERNKYDDKDWLSIVYEELKEKRPLSYSGFSNELGGHTFVVDGFEAGRFHINWGWEGSCDGYFILDNLDPFNYSGFDDNQGMVVGACPPSSAEGNTSKVILSYISCPDRYFERSEGDEYFPAFTVRAELFSESMQSEEIKTGFALCDGTEMMEVLSEETLRFNPGETITHEVQIKLKAILPQGKYKIHAINKAEDGGDWHLDLDYATYSIDVTVDENSVLLQPNPVLDYELDVDYGLHTIDGVTYHLYSTYMGTPNAQLMLRDGKEKYSGSLTVPSTVEFKGMTFRVNGQDSEIFSNSPELTSLTLEVERCGSITNNPKLKELNLLDGVLGLWWVSDCPLLERIEFPASCSEVIIDRIKGEGLKSLTFCNPRQTVFNSEGFLDYESVPNLRDIYFKSDYPAKFQGQDRIVEGKEGITIHIPAGTKDVYLNSIWRNFNLVEDQAQIPTRIEWDYCGDTTIIEPEDSPDGVGVLFGNGDDDVEFAMLIPASSLEPYIGSQITELEYYCHERWEYGSWDFPDYIFLTTPDKDYFVKQACDWRRGGWNTVKLSQPYTITGEDVYVGVGRHSAIFIEWAGAERLDNRTWFRVMGDDYRGYEPGVWFPVDEMYQHAMALKAIIQGENLPSDVIVKTGFEGYEAAAGMQSPIRIKKQEDAVDSQSGYFMKPVAAAKNHTAKSRTAASGQTSDETPRLKVTMRNRSPRTVRNVELSLNLDGKDLGVRNIETVLPTNHEAVSYIDLPTDVSGRNHTLNVEVASIDGEPDAVPENSSPQLNFAYSPSQTFFPRKTVVEEACGTWCGWCPRAIVFFEKLKEEYPENYTVIGIHNDEMGPADFSYDQFFYNTLEYPSAIVNRKNNVNSEFWRIFDMDLTHAEASISAEAAFTEADIITVKTNTTFGFSDDGSTEYRIAYVLLEDKVGPYWQANSFSNPDAEDDPDNDMNWWRHQGLYVETTYDDVARKIYDYDGIPGLLPMQITQGETYAAEYALALPDNLQDTKNLRMATLLLDTRSGEILNADCVPVTNHELSAIRTVTFSNAEHPRIYNLQGQPVADGYKGLVIINGKKMLRK